MKINLDFNIDSNNFPVSFEDQSDEFNSDVSKNDYFDIVTDEESDLSKNFPVNFNQNDESFCSDFSDSHIVEIVTTDHNKLINRDKENQHPIKAIEGLETSLINKIDSSSSLTNFDILEILNK